MKLIISILFVAVLMIFDCSVSATENVQSKIEMTSVHGRSIEYIIKQSESEQNQVLTACPEAFYSEEIQNRFAQTVDTTKAR